MYRENGTKLVVLNLGCMLAFLGEDLADTLATPQTIASESLGAGTQASTLLEIPKVIPSAAKAQNHQSK